MKQVVIDTLHGESHRGLQLAGQVFGELTAIRAIGRREGDGAILWLCSCNCGRFAVRAASSLTAALRENRVSQCSECLLEFRRGSFISRDGANHQRLLELYALTGSLYSEGWTHHEIVKLREEVDAAGLLPVEDENPPSHFTTSEIDYSEKPKHSQRAAYFVPLGAREWRCEACHYAFDTGFGCTACLDVVCLDCARLEFHGCPESKRRNWLKTHTPERAKSLPAGDPLPRGRKILQPSMTDAMRRERVSTLRQEEQLPKETEPKPEPEPVRAAHNRKINWF